MRFPEEGISKPFKDGTWARVVAWRQGKVYRAFDMLTGDEYHTTKRIPGVPDVRGSGSAYRSFTVLTRSRNRPRRGVDAMGVFNVDFLQGGQRDLTFQHRPRNPMGRTRGGM